MATDYLSTLGIGTGLNTTEIVDSLMDVERESRMSSVERKQEALQARISAYGELSEAMQTFKELTDEFKSHKSAGYSISTTDEKILEAKISGSEAQQQSSTVTVSSLAARQILSKSGFSSATAAVGQGSLNIKFGTWSGGSFTQNSKISSVSVSVGASNNTLSGVAQSLNEAFSKAGLDANASVAKASSGGTNDYMLIISSAEGASSSMEITATEQEGAAGLAALSYRAGATTMTQSQTAADASLVVNGVNFTRSSNTITDLLPGIELNLKTASNVAQKLSVTSDSNELKDKLSEFVDGYNSLYTFLDEATSIGESGKRGDLYGESMAKSFLRQLRSMVSSPMKGFNSSSFYLANLGVETNRNGTLSLNNSKYDTAVAANRASFDAMFSSQTKSGSSEVSIVRTSKRNTQPGVYSLTNVVAPTATKITSSGSGTNLSSSALTLSGSGSDNELSLTVNGVTSSVVTVATGTYSSGAILASAIETAINSDANLIAGSSGVKVSFNSSNNTYTITSNKLGSSGSLSIGSISSPLSTALNISTSSSAVQGVNAAGKIDGVSLDSFGSQLTSVSGDSNGLTIDLTEAATSTTISVGSSMTEQLSDMLSGFLTGSMTDNYINSIPEKLVDLDQDVSDIEIETATVETRLEALRERYVSQFTRMEQLSISLKSTSDMMDNLMKSLYSDN